jgi:predicted DNA-binding protein with PD1-like motif
MKSKLLNNDGLRTYALIFDIGDEVISTLTNFAREHNLKASQFTAIGALQEAELKYFNWDTKEYKDIKVNEQVEVLTLAGDIALKEGKQSVHAHIVLGKSDGNAIGGHLAKGIVRPTLEVILNETPSYLKKKFDEQTKLFLIDAE